MTAAIERGIITGSPYGTVAFLMMSNIASNRPKYIHRSY